MPMSDRLTCIALVLVAAFLWRRDVERAITVYPIKNPRFDSQTLTFHVEGQTVTEQDMVLGTIRNLADCRPRPDLGSASAPAKCHCAVVDARNWECESDVEQDALGKWRQLYNYTMTNGYLKKHAGFIEADFEYSEWKPVAWWKNRISKPARVITAPEFLKE